jgi:uncharacterized protein YyaL (SSP411 family)
MFKSIKYRRLRRAIAFSLPIKITWICLIFGVAFSPAASPENIASAEKSQTGQTVKYNRLINESSPYLLQHATNPVDWYPWSTEAFDRARREDKPIFLSIGYSTCHWCHVMEQESFSDPEVAALLNKDFVSIKVDREERPDIDKIYMTVTQAMTGSGGWPMTVILTADKKPFFAGTYFPKNPRWGKPGLMEILPKIIDVWKNDRKAVIKNANQITDLLTRISKRQPGDVPDAQILTDAQHRLAEIYDAEFGGFGNAPKFPTPHSLTFLLRQYHHSKNTHSLAMVEKTLTQMRLGGIYDQVGFGFHRYSTDAQWRVPHFEKMLYDQALLAMAYIEAYQVTGNRFYAQTAREIFTYVLRDMTANGGGFYSAQDADSEGSEGEFYLWTVSEIQKILDKDESELFLNIFNVKIDGNFPNHDPESTKAKNILYLKKPVAEDDLQTRLERIRKELFQERKKRIHPFKDDKILTDWNGLMIAALAKGGKALEEPRYTAAAEKAADFILLNLRDDNNRLLRRYRQGNAGVSAQLNDYAFMIWGLLELYENTYQPKYLKSAIHLNDHMLLHFWDNQNGGLFLTADDSENILVRQKDVYDGAIPSGNSVAMLNLLRLSRFTGNKDYSARAERIVKAFSIDIRGYPAGHTQFMLGLNFALHPNYEVVVVGNSQSKDTLNMLAALRKPFLPETLVIFIPTDRAAGSEMNRLAPFTRTMKALNNLATAYVCQDFVCKLPTNSVAQMQANLKQILN